MTQKHILFVGNSAKYFHTHRLILAKAILNEGWKVSVALPENDQAHFAALEQEGIAVEPYVFSRSGMNPFAEIFSILSLVKVISRVQPDVMHALTVKPCLYGGLAARFKGVPRRVFAFLGLGYLFYSPQKKAKIIRSVLQYVFKLALGGKEARYIFQNPDDEKLFFQSGLIAPSAVSQSAVILGSGVDPAEYRNLPAPEENDRIVLFAGRLTAAKGVEDFVDAAKIVKATHPEVRFVICGGLDGSNPEMIAREQMDGWVESGVIEWWGHRDDMKAVLAGSTIVALPSRYGEGVPKVLIEAAAAGKAIVTTHSPGCREIVNDGLNGYLVPVAAPDALAQAIEKLLKDDQQREAMGAAGQKRVDELFSIQTVVEKTIAVYN